MADRSPGPIKYRRPCEECRGPGPTHEAQFRIITPTKRLEVCGACERRWLERQDGTIIVQWIT